MRGGQIRHFIFISQAPHTPRLALTQSVKYVGLA